MAAGRPPAVKADPAAPAVTQESAVQHGAAGDEDEKPPLLEDVMQLARIDDIPAVKRLFDNGTVTAEFKDSEGITPLHWAAINNRYAMCKFLIEKGCDVNAKGGEAVATPAMWAAQRCNYYVVHLLLQHGADPLLQDASGYNLLHLATFDGNIFLLTMLLHQTIPIDVADPQGHTCLMWAAYKGFPQAVDLFLRWGASVESVDENGFNALHWALVRGSPPCIAKILEYGADRFAATSDGKTPTTIANEMKTRHAWTKALRDGGYDEEGHTKQLPFLLNVLMRDKQLLTRALFFYPFLILPIAMYILSGLVIFAAVPIMLVFVYGSQYLLQQVLKAAPPDMRHMHKTPFLAGVFAGSLFWLGIRWILRILPSTFGAHSFMNIFFAICYALCTYFYALAMMEDPGYVPKSSGRSQSRAVVEELLELWKFDEHNFCTSCMVRTPLRSKHCRRCKRCVAKHDHHCPWIYNCVGVNNLRHFVLYIMSMEVGIILFVRLVLNHLETLPAPGNPQCNLLAEDICKITLRDPFTVVLTVWCALQLTWVTMLIIVQLTQISRATTTYENMHKNHETPQGAAGAITAALTAGSTSLEGAQIDPTGAPNDGHDSHGHSHGHSHDKGCLSQWTKLLGLDTFFAIAFGGSKAMEQKKKGKAGNPFSRGMVTNCTDFWMDPGPIFGRGQVGQALLGGEAVNYARMYESPRMHMMRRPQGESTAVYHNIAAEEEA